MSQFYTIPNFLPESSLVSLVKEANDCMEDGTFHYEKAEEYYKNSYGGITPLAWEILTNSTNTIENLVGLKLTEENPYTRIYNNGSKLGIHTDRPRLDWSISVCLYNDTGQEWPLYAKSETTLKFPTTVNTAYLFAGRRHAHWRDTLTCEANQKVICLFLHWSERATLRLSSR